MNQQKQEAHIESNTDTISILWTLSMV